MRRIIGSVVGVAAVLALPLITAADGVYVPPSAYPRMPEIPAQRAIIAHRNGVETLIVESALKSEADRAAWILPLPAEPTEIRPVDPGVLTTAWFCTRPVIRHYIYGDLITLLKWYLVPFAIAFGVVAAGRLFRFRADLVAIGGAPFVMGGYVFGVIIAGTHPSALVDYLFLAALIVFPVGVLVWYLRGPQGQRGLHVLIAALPFFIFGATVGAVLTRGDPWFGLEYGIALMAVAVVGVLLASTLRAPNRKARLRRLCLTLIVALVCLFLWNTTSQSMRTAGVTGRPVVAGVDVLQVRRAGSYDVAILRARTPEALADWLTAGGFSTPDERAQRLIADYISGGWCFAVASLRLAAGEASKPHPLQVAFPSAKPVYPMRLTRLPGSTVDLDLYVVAERRAAHPLLETVFCDRYTGRLNEYWGETRYNGEVSDGIGLPDLCDLMWDGCMLTRLSGEVAPTRMADDFTFTFDDGGPLRRTFYTRVGAGRLATVIALAGLLVGAVAATLIRALMHAPKAAVVVLAGIGPVVLAGLVAAGTYVRVPRTEVGQARRGGKGGASAMTVESLFHAAAISAGPMKGRVTADTSDTEAEAIMLEEVAAFGPENTNPFLGGPYRCEKSPGNFRIEHLEGRRWITVYGTQGTPRRTMWPMDDDKDTATTD